MIRVVMECWEEQGSYCYLSISLEAQKLVASPPSNFRLRTDLEPPENLPEPAPQASSAWSSFSRGWRGFSHWWFCCDAILLYSFEFVFIANTNSLRWQTEKNARDQDKEDQGKTHKENWMWDAGPGQWRQWCNWNRQARLLCFTVWSRVWRSNNLW